MDDRAVILGHFHMPWTLGHLPAGSWLSAPCAVAPGGSACPLPSAELCVETEEHFPCYVCVRDAWGEEAQQLPEAPTKLL